MKEYMFNGLNMNKPKNKRNRKKNIEDKSINWHKVVKLVILVLLVLLVIGFVIIYEKHEPTRNFFDEYIFRKHISENTLPTIDLNYSDSYSFHVYNDKVLLLSKNVLTFYNKHGNKEFDLDIEVTNPIFKSNDNYLCVAEKDGQRIYLIEGHNIIWQKDLEGNISDISLNKNGYVSVSLSGTSYKTIVLLINPQGSELFKNYLSSSYVIDTSVCDNNKYLAIAEANLTGALIQSNIKIISIEAATQNSSDSIVYNYIAPSNNLIINVEYISKDVLVCKFDDHISFIKDNQVTEISKFNDSNVIFADINDRVIQVVKESNGIINTTFKLEIITPNGSNIKTYNIGEEPKSIQVYDNIVAINLGSEVLFVNNNGWLIKQYESSQEVKEIILCDNLAGIIYSNKIEIISL